MRVEPGDDLRPLSLGESDVLVDKVDVRLQDREGTMRLAPQHVGGAGRFVVQQLSKEHRTSSRGRPYLALDKLSSDLLNIKPMEQNGAKDALFEAIAVMG